MPVAHDGHLAKLAEHSLMESVGHKSTAAHNKQHQSCDAITASSPQLSDRKLSLPADLTSAEEKSNGLVDFDFAITGIQSALQGHHTR